MARGATSRKTRRDRRQGLGKGPSELTAAADAAIDASAFAAVAATIDVAPPDPFAALAQAFTDDAPEGEEFEPAADDECAACAHPFSMHDGDEGACAGEGCECEAYDAGDTAALVAAAGDVRWGPEDGFVDLANDLTAALNGFGVDGEEMESGRLTRDEEAYVLDVSVDLTRALVVVMDWESYAESVYVVPFTAGADNEPTSVATRDEWAPVETGWVEVASAYRAAHGTLGLSDAVARYALDKFQAHVHEIEGERREAAEAAFDALSARVLEAFGWEPVPSTTESVLADAVFPEGFLVASPAKLDGFVEGLLAAGTVEAVVQRFRLLFDKPALLADGVAIEPAEQQPAGTSLEWTATLCPEGHATVDGRIMAPGAVEWRELPLTLCRMLDSPHADVVTASPACGKIERIWRAGNLVKAAGVFSGTDVGVETAGMVERQELRGISVDTAIQVASREFRADVVDDTGDWLDTAPTAPTPRDPIELLLSDAPTIFVMWSLVIGAATVCPFQAFDDATIQFGAPASLKAAGAHEVATVRSDAGWVVARPDGAPAPQAAPVAAEGASLPDPLTLVAGAPVAPPAAWFTDPGLEGPTPLTVTDDGQVYGHAALWDTCHIGFPAECVVAPHSAYGYAFFHLKSVVADDGQTVPVGTITMDAPHAPAGVGRAVATAHYDNTGYAVADVITGEDAYGPWVAGALRPGVTDEQVRALRGAALSGDWRRVGGNLELIAWLAVNVPGFPVPRPEVALVASADGPHVEALIAVGVNVDGHPTGFDQGELDEILGKMREFAEASEIAALAATVVGG